MHLLASAGLHLVLVGALVGFRTVLALVERLHAERVTQLRSGRVVPLRSVPAARLHVVGVARRVQPLVVRQLLFAGLGRIPDSNTLV